MDKLFDEQSKYIRIYIGTETIQDPYEKTVSETILNPLPIKAIVTDLIASQSLWKLPGIVTDKAKEIIIKKKHKDMLEMSRKIEIDSEFYEGWKINGKLQYRTEGNYIRAYIYIKKV